MPGCRPPVIDPLLPDAVSSFDKFAARALPVLDQDDDPSVEFSLRVINIGQTLPLYGNYVLNCHFCSVSLEHAVSLYVLTSWRKVS